MRTQKIVDLAKTTISDIKNSQGSTTDQTRRDALIRLKRL